MSRPVPESTSRACFAATRALCNSCGRLGEAKIVFEDERVLLEKWCPDHGITEALISSDRGWYLRSLGYLKPGTDPKSRAVAEHAGCPDSCGLCPEHQQHSCVPILEITDRCDLNCPICLVAGAEHPTLSVKACREILDNLVAYEGRLNMLTLSGGEPTSHPDFLEIVDACQRPEVGILSVSTNGVRLAREHDLLRALVDRGVVISLQFDGVQADTYARLRGQPELAALKTRLIQGIIELGGRLSLTLTLARGVNEDELGEVLALLFGHDEILSLMVQPLAYTGQARRGQDPLDIITIPEVITRLAAASRGVLREEDFSPLPCSHPTCFALTYLLKTEKGELVPLPSVIDTDSYLDIIKNQALLATDLDSLSRIRDALYGLWSSDGIIPNREAVLRTVKRILLDLNELGAGASPREVLSLGTQNVKSIFIHHFMDRATFDLSRAVKCCNHYPLADGRLIPACIRNNVGIPPSIL